MTDLFETIISIWEKKLKTDTDFALTLDLGTPRNLKFIHRNEVKYQISKIDGFLEIFEKKDLSSHLDFWQNDVGMSSEYAHIFVPEEISTMFDALKRLETRFNKLNRELDFLSQKEKYIGPDGAPLHLHKMICVAFELFEDNSENLEKFREYIKPNGRFVQEMNKNYNKETLLSALLSNRGDQSISKWRSQLKRTAEIRLVSVLVNKDIRSLKKFPTQTKHVRDEIHKIAIQILSELK